MKYLYDYRQFRNTAHLFFIFLLLCPVPANSQSRPVCSYCGKSIPGTIISAGKSFFHPEHFLCAYCGKIISGGYNEKDDKFYHPDCYKQNEGLTCAYCGKLLEDEYIVSTGKKYHPECYEKNVLPKCSVCSLPLKDKFSVDIYGNKYHPAHSAELPKCDCCKRLICQNLTRGGKRYSDGRNICTLCFLESVSEQYQINEILKKVISKLNSFGINLNEKNIKAIGVDRNELKRRSSSFSDNTQGFCDSETKSNFLNDKLVSKLYHHTIYILSGTHYLSMEATLAHELMHAWMTENCSEKLPDKIKEGSCNYISYLYLNSLTDSKKNDFIKLLENDPDPVYGKGFKEIKFGFENKSLTQLLAYLKAKN